MGPPFSVSKELLLKACHKMGNSLMVLAQLEAMLKVSIDPTFWNNTPYIFLFSFGVNRKNGHILYTL